MLYLLCSMFRTLRYRRQHRGERRVSEEIRERLLPETLAFISQVHQEVVKKDVITLT